MSIIVLLVFEKHPVYESLSGFFVVPEVHVILEATKMTTFDSYMDRV